MSARFNLTEVSENANLTVMRVAKCLAQCGVSREDIETFKKEARSGDYDHLMTVCVRALKEQGIPHD